MPIVMTGYVITPTDTLAEHIGHTLQTDGTSLSCYTCHDTRNARELAREHRSTSLPCGCGTQAEHAEGAASQRDLRKRLRITRSACVGCYLGDDGLSMHNCYMHGGEGRIR